MTEHDDQTPPVDRWRHTDKLAREAATEVVSMFPWPGTDEQYDGDGNLIELAPTVTVEFQRPGTHEHYDGDGNMIGVERVRTDGKPGLVVMPGREMIAWNARPVSIGDEPGDDGRES